MNATPAFFALPQRATILHDLARRFPIRPVREAGNPLDPSPMLFPERVQVAVPGRVRAGGIVSFVWHLHPRALP